MSEERVNYWFDRIYDAHTYRKDFAINELIDMKAEIQEDKELTEEEREKVLKFYDEILEYVEDRPEEFD
jgi:hypothetical protein